MSNSLYETECAQVDALIQQKKDEIKKLEELKDSWSEEYWDNASTTSPAKVAADPNASSEERAAAANATLGQDPVRVNAEQSFPTPSTHDEAKEANERRFEQLNRKLNEEAQADTGDEGGGEGFNSEAQGIDLPDGRGDANKLGEAGQVEEGAPAPDSAKERTVDAGTAEEEIKDAKESEKKSAEKQAETNKNKSDVATKGKTDDKSQSTSSKKAESKDK